MNLFKPQSENKTTSMLFFIFEIFAFVYSFVYFIFAIIFAVRGTFANFIETLLSALSISFIIFGLGKVIDLLGCNKQNKKNEEHKNNEDKKENE